MRKIILSGDIQIPEGDLEAVRAALPAHIAATRAEPGCIIFEVSEDPHDPCRFRVYEEFDSMASFDEHQRRAAASDWSEVTRNVVRNYTIEEK